MLYLDNASTTMPIFTGVDFVEEYWANPNSRHKIGSLAYEMNEKAREIIRKNLKVKTGHIIMGPVASQLFYIVYSLLKNSCSFYSSTYEHSCIDSVIKRSENKISHVFNIKRNCNFYQKVFCWQYVNNLNGKIWDIEEIGKQCKYYGYYFLCDMTAAIGHVKIPDNFETYCDCIICSAHKFHGPRCGFMWLSNKLYEELNKREKIEIILGTPNVTDNLAMAYALEYVNKNLEFYDNKWKKAIEYLNIYDIQLDKTEKSNAINAITFDDILAEPLCNFLSTKEIYVSPFHSACEYENLDSYRVAKALGYSQEEAAHTIRLSFGSNDDADRIEEFGEAILEFKEKFC